jgi:Ca2+-binding EF-hand superfamily protein
LSDEERRLLLAAVEQVVEDIWDNYDKDGNGFLDLREARKFLRDVIRESGLYAGEGGSNHFEEVGHRGATRLEVVDEGHRGIEEERHVREAFLEIDADNNRRISKEEMKE